MTLCYSHRKEDPFVRLDKRIVMDNNLSWKAKGILSYAFSRPEDWQFYQKEMEKNAKDGRDSLTSGLKELEEARYLYRINRKNKETGQFEGFEWHFFEVPISEEEFKKCYRNGLSVSRETPVMGIPVTTKKDSLSKKENNKRGSVEPVVIPSQEKENQEAIYKRSNECSRYLQGLGLSSVEIVREGYDKMPIEEVKYHVEAGITWVEKKDNIPRLVGIRKALSGKWSSAPKTFEEENKEWAERNLKKFDMKLFPNGSGIQVYKEGVIVCFKNKLSGANQTTNIISYTLKDFKLKLYNLFKEHRVGINLVD